MKVTTVTQTHNKKYCAGILTGAMACLFASMPAQAYTNPITGLRAGEYPDKIFNAGIEYRSGSVFRGIQQTEENVTLNVEFAPKVPVLGLGVRLGGQAILPLDEEYRGIDEPKEIALYGVAVVPVFPTIDLEVGGTFYGYPAIGGDDYEDGDPDTFELMAGLVFGLPFTKTLLDADATLRADGFYDIRRETSAVEGNIRLQKTFFSTVTLDAGAYIGYEYVGDLEKAIELESIGVRQIAIEYDNGSFSEYKRGRNYHGFRGDIFYDPLENVRIGGGVRYDGISGADYFFQDDLENGDFYYSGAVRIGF